MAILLERLSEAPFENPDAADLKFRTLKKALLLAITLLCQCLKFHPGMDMSFHNAHLLKLIILQTFCSPPYHEPGPGRAQFFMCTELQLE